MNLLQDCPISDPRLDFAWKLLPALEGSIINLYGQIGDGESKDDGSLVTELDYKLQDYLLQQITKQFPHDSILAEEGPTEIHRDGDYRWVLDPIDGTFSLIHNAPQFSVLISLWQSDQPVSAVLYFPALHRVLVAALGKGAYQCTLFQGQYSSPLCLTDCLNKTTSRPDLWCHSGREFFSGDPRLQQLYQSLQGQFSRERSWGDAFGHTLVALGKSALMVESALYPWDFGPLKVLLQETGGAFFHRPNPTPATDHGPFTPHLCLSAMPHAASKALQAIEKFFTS